MLILPSPPFPPQPSVIEETVRLRLEMLGSAFTAQHSDCRVLEQLLYKWKHSREVIIKVRHLSVCLSLSLSSLYISTPPLQLDY